MAFTTLVGSGIAALIFAGCFIWGGRIHPLRAIIRERRTLLSFGAGMSAAYVFVKLIPELAAVRSSFAAAIDTTMPFRGMAIYFVALLGFLAFYGLDHLRAHLADGFRPGQPGLNFKLHVAGFSAYVSLMGYLLVNSLEQTNVSLLFYTLAIAVHFLALDHSLRHEHGALYDRTGRWILAGMAILGWGMGLAWVLPEYVLALLVAFVSGAIIINSLIMELPSEKDGRFWPFLSGGIVYGLVLLPLG